MPDRVLKSGLVVDSAGRPIAGAWVAVTWGTEPVPEIGRRTNTEGRFQLGLPPGRFRLQVTTPAGAATELEIEGGNEAEIVIRIGTAPAESHNRL